MRSILAFAGLLCVGASAQQAVALNIAEARQHFYVYMDDTFWEAHQLASGDVSLELFSEALIRPLGACGIDFLDVASASVVFEDGSESDLDLTEAARSKIRVVFPGCELPGTGVDLELPPGTKVVHLGDVGSSEWINAIETPLGVGTCVPCRTAYAGVAGPLRQAQLAMNHALANLELGLVPANDGGSGQPSSLAMPLHALSRELRRVARVRRTWPSDFLTAPIDQLERAARSLVSEALEQVGTCRERIQNTQLDSALASCFRATARLQEIDRTIQFATMLRNGPNVLPGRSGHVIRPQ